MIKSILLSLGFSKETFEKVLRTGLIAVGVTIMVLAFLKLLGIEDSFTIMLCGVPVNVSLWTIIAVVLFWINSVVYIRKHQGGETEFAYFAVGLLLAFLVLLSVVAHEFGHAVVASWFGNPITEAGISWWGGFVKSSDSLVSITPLGQIAIALAGPVTNIVLALISSFIVWKFGESLFENSVQYFAVINIRLAKINLIPFIAVLDGGKALRGFLSLVGVGEKIMPWVSLIVGTFIYVTYRTVTRDKESLEERLAKL